MKKKNRHSLTIDWIERTQTKQFKMLWNSTEKELISFRLLCLTFWILSLVFPYKILLGVRYQVILLLVKLFNKLSRYQLKQHPCLFQEVDLVAAPLIIDAHRETVADFTQPYFHEKSGIIIKKPVQSHSTKLVDPLNPMVYLCVGISLPVITLLLFLFEKYNPFYRQVPGRMKIRGLHHFSDSFWYLYGALLCQGRFLFHSFTRNIC